MIQEAHPEQIAAALDSDEFWETARAEWAESGRVIQKDLQNCCSSWESVWESALDLLPDSRREEILGYLAQMGKCLSARDLVRIVGHEDQGSGRLGPAKSSS